jgi:hypothetical protein
MNDTNYLAVEINMLSHTPFVNDVARIFQMPSEMRAKIIESTDTVEQRNLTIVNSCILKFILETRPGYKPRDAKEYFKDNFDRVIIEFLTVVTTILMKERDEL